jgi:NTE family protein
MDAPGTITATRSPDSHRVALVLGAGGTLGWAYHLGVLDAVAEVLGHRPSQAARLIGTSAGAAIAASVLHGATRDEILSVIATPPDGAELAEMWASLAALRRPSRWLQLTSLRMLRNRDLGVAALSGLLPPGVFPTTSLRRFPVGRAEGPWPTNLWVPAVRAEDGRRVVFGRDDTSAALLDSIEATAAVPLLFQPKVIGSTRYLDGALRSATNADLLLEDGPYDLVIISSPMSGPGGSPLRRRARTQVRREAAALRSTGAQVLILEPSAHIGTFARGFPRRRPHRGPAIVAKARDEAITTLLDGAAPQPPSTRHLSIPGVSPGTGHIAASFTSSIGVSRGSSPDEAPNSGEARASPSSS